MKLKSGFSLRSMNTYGVEAAAARYVRFDSEEEIVDFLSRNSIDGQRCLVLGGGSNLLFIDDFDGIVLHPQLKGIQVIDSDRRHLRIRAMAGENWDDLVALAVANGWGGIENLSFIPGTVGASVVQNIGAYGVEAEAVIDRVEAISIADGKTVVFPSNACGLGYRSSHFKGTWAGQFMVTAVVFKLNRQPEFVLDYPGVKTAIETLGAITLGNVRRAIVAIRQSKLPDPALIGNAGSFFKNPVVSADRLNGLLKSHPDLPHYAQGAHHFKLAAGWMIERCGWKGRRVGRAGVHDRQALVLVNRGGATGREILELSEQVKGAVKDLFSIDLQREVLVIPSPGRRP